MFYLLISSPNPENAMGLQAVEQPETIHTAKRVEDTCICSSLHVQGNRVNVRYYHRCPVHNDTMEHDCTHNHIVTGQSNFVKFRELPETISTPESQLKMLASVLRYTFREVQHTNISTDVPFITTLKNITVREETL